MLDSDKTIAIIGLGYVGLPLAVAFGKIVKVIGFDLDAQRVQELKNGHDKTREVPLDQLNAAQFLNITDDPAELVAAQIYIVTVPTPVDQEKRPDLTPLKQASELVGGFLKKGDIVIYESTVFPGATEEVCVPILENISGLIFNSDFYCGYSPERVNPGDPNHRLETIVKVTSGSTPGVATEIDSLYQKIVTAGTHKASSIQIAEAAKVIENIQRDINIALMNELSVIFSRMDLDTNEVLEAANTKWNFLNFKPGLVGGHCIGVDPYYMLFKAAQLGYPAEMIQAGRSINDRMGKYIADVTLSEIQKRNVTPIDAKILVLGLTFKENCPDLRNSKVTDLVLELSNHCRQVDLHDPEADISEAEAVYQTKILGTLPETAGYDGIILAVPHRFYAEIGPEKLRSLGSEKVFFYDVKGLFGREESDQRL